MATKTGRRKEPLTAVEADRAIYIDLEGNEGPPPTFLDVTCEDEWAVTVLEPEFYSAVERGRRKWVVGFTEPLGPLESSRRRATEEDRRVVAWSIHELEAISAYYDPDDEAIDWWADNLINALPIAKRWANTHRVTLTPVKDFRSAKRGAKTRTALVCFMDAVGYQKHHQYARGKTGKRLRTVRNQLVSKGHVSILSPGAKRDWTNVLNHNRDSCLGLRAVMVHVSESHGVGG